MGYIIAIAGKGGTGKTTIAALIVRIIKEKKLGSILAIDADPNNNLAEALGVKVGESIGSIIDYVAGHLNQIPVGTPKDTFIEYRIQTAVTEAAGFDILTMGRPEGPGCYCYANNVLRNIMAKLAKGYDYIVIDNEAGLEHFSRRTTRAADALVVVSDATKIGLKSAKRIAELIKELDIKAKKRLCIINRYGEDLDNQLIKQLDLDYIGNIPVDEQIMNSSLNGSSLMHLNHDSISLKALRDIGEKIWQKN
jgi:CO dehydrogenase maturation factor